MAAISCLEVAQLVKKGVMVLPLGLPDWFAAALEESEILCLAMTPGILHASTLLPDIHRDPADRIIVATVMAMNGSLVPVDETIRKYPGVRTLWNVGL